VRQLNRNSKRRNCRHVDDVDGCCCCCCCCCWERRDARGTYSQESLRAQWCWLPEIF